MKEHMIATLQLPSLALSHGWHRQEEETRMVYTSKVACAWGALVHMWCACTSLHADDKAVRHLLLQIRNLSALR